ncbi:LysM peptidoglycan-binding domain-containing protein [Bacillaceae bacterium S4-13-58]
MSSINHGDFKDQAHELRERIKREQRGDESIPLEQKEFLIEKNNEKEPKDSVTLLNMPPRSVVHSQSNKGVKFKIKFPLVRLLLLVFIVILLSIPFYHIWQSNYEESDSLSISSEPKVGEMVSIISVNDSNGKVENNEKENTDVEKEMLMIEEVDSEPSGKGDDELTLVSKNEQIQNQDQKIVENPSPRYYQVKKGDTLFSIAMEFYGGKWGEALIIEANELNRKEVFAGETLLIPEE